MTDWLIRMIDSSGYWGIAFLMVLENVFPPVPSEIIMGFGGIRVAQGRMEWLPLLAAGTAGTTVGNLFWYGIGRLLGFERLRPLVDRHGRWLTMEWRDVEALDRIFEKYGHHAVFIFRFMPAFRTMISLPAGLFGMGAIRFVLWTFGGALVWNTVLVAAGWALGSAFTDIDRYLGPVTTGCIIIAVIAYFWRLATWKPRSERD